MGRYPVKNTWYKIRMTFRSNPDYQPGPYRISVATLVSRETFDSKSKPKTRFYRNDIVIIVTVISRPDVGREIIWGKLKIGGWIMMYDSKGDKKGNKRFMKKRRRVTHGWIKAKWKKYPGHGLDDGVLVEINGTNNRSINGKFARIA